MHRYSEDYYAVRKEGTRSSAEVIVPLVLEVVKARSVIDVGCGTGEWLSVFKEHGVEDIWGVDGEHVNIKTLAIPEERFVPYDLKRPYCMDRAFDLVVSLEVAEHLPADCAETLVDSLTGLGSVVLFSAAIPYQGGEHHINEQWPEYWIRLFDSKGYVTIDCLRRKIWSDEEVEFYYAQNIFLFATRETLEKQPALKAEYELHSVYQRSIVHPRMYLQVIETYENSFCRRLVRTLDRVLPPRIQRIARATMVWMHTRAS